jgi:hypothetical protein
MNDKFKQLALEVKMATADFDAGSYYVATPDQMQKLCELIVQECARACINMGNDYEIKSAGQYQAEMFAFAIKKRFEIEP